MEDDQFPMTYPAAERFMNAENINGVIYTISAPAILAVAIRSYRGQLELVIVDANPVTKSGIGFNIDEFLEGLDA